MVSIPGMPSIPGAHYPKKAAKTDRERHGIHKGSKSTDDHKNMPFTFSKPKRHRAKPDICTCEKCGRDSHINKRTCVLVACPCGHLNYLEKEES